MTQPREDSAPDDIRLTNEFAEVVIRPAARGNGTRLHIRSPRRGTEVFIDPVVLEALTAVEPDFFTAILAVTVPGNWESNSLRYDG